MSLSAYEMLQEIANESSTNKKMEILSKFKDSELLKKVLYLTDSPRVKFYIKQIPAYTRISRTVSLDQALDMLTPLSSRIITGHEASAHLQSILASLEEKDALVLERVIGKDQKIGMGGNINKIIKDLIEETPYMGAVPFSPKVAQAIVDSGYALSQIKMDGRYANCLIANSVPYLESRAGETTYLPSDCPLIKELATISKDVVLCGELTMGPEYTRYEANGIVASIVSINKKLAEGQSVAKEVQKFEKERGSYEKAVNSIIYTVWDVITIDEYDAKVSHTPYHERLKNVTELIEGLSSVKLVESKRVYTYEEVINEFREAVLKGEEGTILKDANGIWKDSKPKYQCKVKLQIELDLKITAFHYGTKGTKYEKVISSIEVQTSDGLLITNPAGIKEAMMKYITENQDILLGGIVKTECSGLSVNSKGEYSCLHPRFIEIRTDKTVADTLQQAIAIENMAKGLA